MHPDADAINAAPLATAGPVVARFCAHCGADSPPAGHDCRAPAVIGSRALPQNAWHDLYEVRGALLLYFSIIAACAVGLVATGFGLATDVHGVVAAEVGASIAIALVVLVGCVRARDLRPVLGEVGAGRWYLIAPIAALGTFGIAHLASTSIDEIFNVPHVTYSNPYLEAGWGWWLPILIVCVQPAIFEELAFRGIMTSSLQPVLGTRETLFVVALLFAIIHLNPIGFVHLFVAGLALGYLRHLSGSLYPGMLLHFCHNGLALLQEYTA